MDQNGKALWRRGEVMEFLGVGKRVMRRLIRTGKLTPRYLEYGGRRRKVPMGRALFLRDEVVRLAREG